MNLFEIVGNYISDRKQVSEYLNKDKKEEEVLTNEIVCRVRKSAQGDGYVYDARVRYAEIVLLHTYAPQKISMESFQELVRSAIESQTIAVEDYRLLPTTKRKELISFVADYVEIVSDTKDEKKKMQRELFDRVVARSFYIE